MTLERFNKLLVFAGDKTCGKQSAYRIFYVLTIEPEGAELQERPYSHLGAGEGLVFGDLSEGFRPDILGQNGVFPLFNG